jgi:hypothetical protein
MQESDRTIERGFHVFRAGGGKVDGAELFGRELVVVVLVGTGQSGKQEKSRAQSGNPTHTASENELSHGRVELGRTAASMRGPGAARQ